MMGRYDKKNGFYPNYKKNADLLTKLSDSLDVVYFMIHKNIKEARLRVIMNDIYEYFEQYEDFHYGVSTEANKLTELNSKNTVLEHAVPSHIVIEKLKTLKPHRDNLLDFFKNHYFMCIITKQENKRLDNGLRNSMPKSWNHNWNNWECRYNEKNITLIIKPGNTE